jgi:hypothetical protein
MSLPPPSAARPVETAREAFTHIVILIVVDVLLTLFGLALGR